MFHLFAAFCRISKNLIQERSIGENLLGQKRIGKIRKEKIERMKAISKDGSSMKDIASMLEIAHYIY
jgi:hypothetical protein